MINTLAYEISQVHIEREVHRDSPIKSLYYDGMWYVVCAITNSFESTLIVSQHLTPVLEKQH